VIAKQTIQTKKLHFSLINSRQAEHGFKLFVGPAQTPQVGSLTQKQT